MASGKYHHYGVPTTEKREKENYIEAGGVYATDPEDHPYRVEFLRFDPDSPMHETVRTEPHVAFVVENLEEAVKDQNVIVPPFDALETIRVAFIKDGDALIELMEMK